MDNQPDMLTLTFTGYSTSTPPWPTTHHFHGTQPSKIRPDLTDMSIVDRAVLRAYCQYIIAELDRTEETP